MIIKAKTGVTLALILAIIGFFISLEIIFFDPYLLVFTCLFTLVFYFALCLISARWFFSIAALSLIIVTTETMSHIKFGITNFSLHAEDLYYYLFSPPNLLFLYEHFFIYLVYIALIFLVFTGLIIVFLKFEQPSIHRLKALIGLVLCLSPLLIFPQIKQRASVNAVLFSGFYDRHLASFYLSLYEIVDFKAQKNEKLAGFPLKPYENLLVKQVDNPPQIILIHQESVIPPSLFKNLAYNKLQDDFYLSHDKKFHKMRVEIFAGTSWMTEFSIFTGLSPLDYGMKRPFVFTLNIGKINESLLLQTKRLGYKNLHFFPMLKEFSNYDKFYGSIGMDKVFDLKDFNITTPFQRDNIYYHESMNRMEAHFKTSQQPLFNYIQTMSAHFPYGHKFEPNENPPATFPQNEPEVNEYLRRIWFSRQDYQQFKTDLSKKFPDKQFLIVHYGDHHPTVTRKLVLEEDKLLRATSRDNRFFQSNSVGLQTYFVVDGVNFIPQSLPDYEIIDAAYLGDIVLESARLPLSDISKARKNLMQLCKGRFFSCENQEAVKAFHKFVAEKGGVK
jgi:phosphoglycerol transferase MdoB-like AlkP superfamily enzyme